MVKNFGFVKINLLPFYSKMMAALYFIRLINFIDPDQETGFPPEQTCNTLKHELNIYIDIFI